MTTSCRYKCYQGKVVYRPQTSLIMGRPVKYELIANESVRKQTFKSRKGGLFQKASELTTLCCVEACIIIYSKYNAQPHVWPSPIEAHHFLKRFQDLPVDKQNSHMTNQENYLRQNIVKLGKNVEKEKEKNHWVEMEEFVIKGLVNEYNLGDCSNLVDLKSMDCLLDEKIKLVKERMESIKQA